MSSILNSHDEKELRELGIVGGTSMEAEIKHELELIPDEKNEVKKDENKGKQEIKKGSKLIFLS